MKQQKINYIEAPSYKTGPCIWTHGDNPEKYSFQYAFQVISGAPREKILILHLVNLCIQLAFHVKTFVVVLLTSDLCWPRKTLLTLRRMKLENDVLILVFECGFRKKWYFSCLFRSAITSVGAVIISKWLEKSCDRNVYF